MTTELSVMMKMLQKAHIDYDYHHEDATPYLIIEVVYHGFKIKVNFDEQENLLSIEPYIKDYSENGS
jgi:hypothetical protein